MSGNAMEEGLLLQIHNPSHVDPTRFGFLAGALSGMATIVVTSFLLPNTPLLIAVYLALGIAAAVGTLVTRRIVSRRANRDIAGMIATRARHEVETKRQIAEMIGSGTA